MAQRKQRNKLKPHEIEKRRARYFMKLEEFKGKTKEELKEIFETVKMSSTDKMALLEATDLKLEEELSETIAETQKESEEPNGDNESNKTEEIY